MSAEYDIETGVMALYAADSYFATTPIVHSKDESSDREPCIMIECAGKQPDMLDGSGKAVSWYVKLSATPCTYTTDDKDGADVEAMATNAHRVMESFTLAILESAIPGYDFTGIEADDTAREQDGNWNNHTVSRLVYFTIT